MADLEYDVARLALVTVKLTEPRPCRWCGHPTSLADGDGPTHRCCNVWQIVGRRCPGCAESASAWTEYERRQKERAADARRRASRAAAAARRG